MTPSHLAAARRFVALATKEHAPAIDVLARSLDELALSYYDTPPGMPDENAPAPPEPVFTHASVGSRFPELGLYGVANPSETAGSVIVGDAIDDILDIARDLSEVIWRYENVGAEDADWHFRLLYQCHWGVHLRDLSRYLHEKQFD